MANYLPLVIVSGVTTELPPGDTTIGLTLGSVVAGSGLEGGGSLSTSARLDVALAPNPSGLIFVGDKLADDGASLRTGEEALASGLAAQANITAALASGNASLNLSDSAIASGNAVYPILDSTASQGVIKSYVASSVIVSGSPVGVDDAGQVQTIRFYQDGFALTNGNNGYTPFVSGAMLELCVSEYHAAQDAFLLAYRNTSASNYGWAQSARINGAYIDYGTPIIFNSANTTSIDLAYSTADQRFVAVYNAETAVANISGLVTSFSAGAPFAGGSAPAVARSLCYHPRDNVFGYFYNVGQRGRISLAKINGNSLNFGITDQILTDSYFTESIDSAYDSSSEQFYVTFPESNYDLGVGLLVNTSGVSSYLSSSEFLYGEADVTQVKCAYDASADKIVTVYNSTNLTPYTAKVIVASVSGSTLTYGPSQSVSSRTQYLYPSLVYDPYYSRNILCYKQNNVYQTTQEPVTIHVFNLSGYYIDRTSRAEALSSFLTNPTYPTYPYLSVNNSGSALVIAGAGTTTATASGIAWVLSEPKQIAPTKDWYNNYIGVAQNTTTSGGTVYVRLPGSIDGTNSGISAGLSYYLSPETSGFTTDPTRVGAWSGSFPWRAVGMGAGPTQIVLTDSL
jgi:hypothetical protein